MNTRGRHLLVEYRGCPPGRLDDPGAVEEALRKAARAARATVLGSFMHRFSPTGVSGVVVIAESHISIHTWPEFGYAASDFYTCGECEPECAHRVLAETFAPSSMEILTIDRGLTVDPRKSGIALRSHIVDGPFTLRTNFSGESR